MTTEKQKLLSKIRKLLSLGERAGTEAEAQAAMSAAYKLLAEHNLDMEQVIASGEEKREDLITDESTPSALRNTSPSDTIWSWIAKLYFCETFFRTKRNEGKRFYCITGRPSNIAIVKYMGAYLIKTMEGLAQDEGKKAAQRMADKGITLNLRRWRASFHVGFANRIAHRVHEEIEKAKAGKITASDGRALVLLSLYENEGKAVKVYREKVHGKMSICRRSTLVHSSSGYESGRNAANVVNLSANGIGNQQPKRIA